MVKQRDTEASSKLLNFRSQQLKISFGVGFTYPHQETYLSTSELLH